MVSLYSIQGTNNVDTLQAILLRQQTIIDELQQDVKYLINKLRLHEERYDDLEHEVEVLRALTRPLRERKHSTVSISQNVRSLTNNVCFPPSAKKLRRAEGPRAKKGRRVFRGRGRNRGDASDRSFVQHRRRQYRIIGLSEVVPNQIFERIFHIIN
jgi:hypothetical protein